MQNFKSELRLDANVRFRPFGGTYGEPMNAKNLILDFAASELTARRQPKSSYRGMSVCLICLSVACSILSASTAEGRYSWNEDHALVVPTGDLLWLPHAFVYESGESRKYIDYENGNDYNEGTRESPWKHHPWDPNATGNAGACGGIHTYVFKRGVIYRGVLKAGESGRRDNPIRLTSDPSWGEGEACLFGSGRIEHSWTQCNSSNAPGIPAAEKVWYVDIGDIDAVHAVWEIHQDSVTRIPVARAPNWRVSNRDDPQLEWSEWQDIKVEDKPDGSGRLRWQIDSDILTQDDDSFYEGGYVWTEYADNMGTIHAVEIAEYDPERNALRTEKDVSHGQMKPGCRYFIEKVRGLLDTAGEYFFDESLRRLYIRLPDERDPNRSHIEVARISRIVDIVDQSNIEISGIRFSFNGPFDAYEHFWPPCVGRAPAIRLAGNCRHIVVKNCTFFHIMGAIVAYPRFNEQFMGLYQKDLRPWKADTISDILISDNDIAYADEAGCLSLYNGDQFFRVSEPPFGILDSVKVMRNRLFWIGQRQSDGVGSNIAAIGVTRSETAEIAGNIVDMCWGTGILVHGTKKSGSIIDAPLSRVLIHHNKITNAVLGCNDYGALAPWQGGPIYTYNNIIGNGIGHKHYRPISNLWLTVGYNLYLDGTYKTYNFNNIIWGKSNDLTYPYRNRGGIFQVFGFMDHFFNNTVYRFLHGLGGSSGNRSCFLGNVIADMSQSYIQHNRKDDTSLLGGGDDGSSGTKGLSTLVFDNNVFYGAPKEAGSIGGERASTIDALIQQLKSYDARISTLGVESETDPLVDAQSHDFRPAEHSAAIDRGAAFFVPWALYGVVGEWNFCANTADPTVVIGESFYMTDELLQRKEYYLAPQFDLHMPNTAFEDYVAGPLEDWIEGAVGFDGVDDYGVLTHEAMTMDVEYPSSVVDGRVASEPRLYDGTKRKTVDMDTNNFCIEAYARTESSHTGGVIAAKYAPGTGGYSLDIDSEGRARLAILINGEIVFAQTSQSVVNDGRWYHILAELDRSKGATVYINGKADNGQRTGALPALNVSLSNSADFYVGRNLIGGYFKGTMDFLRVSRGTLADARTDIAELHAWQFDGPFLRDFAGSEPVGLKRDAGALEYGAVAAATKRHEKITAAGAGGIFRKALSTGLSAGINRPTAGIQTTMNSMPQNSKSISFWQPITADAQDTAMLSAVEWLAPHAVTLIDDDKPVRKCIRGYITPPVDSIYQFSVIADCPATLYMSQTESTSHPDTLISLDMPIGEIQWDICPEQQSAPVRLTTKKRRYFELHLMTDRGIGNCQIGWKMDGGDYNIIPETAVQPF